MFAALRGAREVLFGNGQRNALALSVRQYGCRVFVCADPFLAAEDEFGHVFDTLRAAGISVSVFDEVVADLPLDCVAAAVQSAQGYSPDIIIGFGGGSSIDLAKAVAVVLSHGGRIQDYYGELAVPGPVLPLIAMPTTAGTGSEVTPVAVVSDHERGVKVGVSSPHLIPTIAICDPELTYTCPPSVTASSGADALAHCIEAYTAIRRTPSAQLMSERVFVGRGELTDSLALFGIRHLVQGLHTSFTTPYSSDARAHSMLGSLAGGMAFGTAGTAAAHALQYPIGALTGTSHGLGVGVLLPYVMAFNTPSRTAEMAVIADLLGVSGGDVNTRAAQAPRAVAAFLGTVGIPSTLRELGLDEDALQWAATQAMSAERLLNNNPQPVDVDVCKKILTAAYAGDLAAFDTGVHASATGDAVANERRTSIDH